MQSIFFGRRQKLQLNNADATYKVHYLGNVMTSLVKGTYHHGQHNSGGEAAPNVTSYSLRQSCRLRNQPKVEIQHDEQLGGKHKFGNIACSVDKPVKILWDNHLKHNGHAGLKMKLTLTQGGLRVNTKDHGLTEYYGHRIHFIQAHALHPKLFIWVYQHVGKNLKSEIRCHAVLCERARDARVIELLLNSRLQQTFLEYKREKRRQQNSRLCNSKNGGLLAGQLGTRKRAFTTSTKNYKPPVQHGMCSAPKLDDVLEEDEEAEVNEQADLGGNLDDTLSDLKDEFNEGDLLKLPLSSGSSASLNSSTSHISLKLESNNGSLTNSTVSPCSLTSNTYSEEDDEQPLDIKKSNESLSPDAEIRPHFEFNQVSYEFLSDLSQPRLPKLNKSVSFNRKPTFNMKEKPTGGSNGFYNPFCRSSISKSFSAFTSRIKQQQQLGLKQTDKINTALAAIEASTSTLSLDQMSPHTNPKADKLLFQHKLDCIEAQFVLRSGKKMSSGSDSSPMSSPELSCSSDSSCSVSSTNVNLRNQQCQASAATEANHFIISL